MRLPPWLVGLVVVVLLGGLWWSLASDDGGYGSNDDAGGPGADPGPTGTETRSWDGIDACEDEVLPATMVIVVEDIWTDGPFEYPDRDGTRFGNYEGHLPDEDLGYYREYTVRTPGVNHRGPRRIVTGGGTEGEPEVWYYTQDHYESFCEFAP